MGYSPWGRSESDMTEHVVMHVEDWREHRVTVRTPEFDLQLFQVQGSHTQILCSLQALSLSMKCGVWGLVRKGELKKVGHRPLLLFNSLNLWLVLLYLEDKLMVDFHLRLVIRLFEGEEPELGSVTNSTEASS